MRRPMLLAATVLLIAPALAQATPTAGGITWKAPKEWKAQPARPMRAATYLLPSVGGGEAPELAVFYFGKNQGGTVEANIERWAAQFDAAEGAPRTPPKISKSKVNGLALTRVETRGIYNAAMGPMGPRTAKPGFRLLGAIVEGPEGPVFFKLTGPEKGVRAAEKAFEKMLGSVAPAS